MLKKNIDLPIKNKIKNENNQILSVCISYNM